MMRELAPFMHGIKSFKILNALDFPLVLIPEDHKKKEKHQIQIGLLTSPFAILVVFPFKTVTTRLSKRYIRVTVADPFPILTGFP